MSMRNVSTRGNSNLAPREIKFRCRRLDTTIRERAGSSQVPREAQESERYPGLFFFVSFFSFLIPNSRCSRRVFAPSPSRLSLTLPLSNLSPCVMCLPLSLFFSLSLACALAMEIPLGPLLPHPFRSSLSWTEAALPFVRNPRCSPRARSALSSSAECPRTSLRCRCRRDRHCHRCYRRRRRRRP